MAVKALNPTINTIRNKLLFCMVIFKATFDQNIKQIDFESHKSEPIAAFHITE